MNLLAIYGKTIQSGTLHYEVDDLSFGFETSQPVPGRITSILVNDLELDVDTAGRLVGVVSRLILRDPEKQIYAQII